VPTRYRNHNGYLLRWDGEGLLFDPGEGTQRQMLLAGVAPSSVTRLCLTHFHGDHCLGVPGVIQRLSLDRVNRPVPAHYPRSGREYFARLRHASVFHDMVDIPEEPVGGDGPVAVGDFGVLEARLLDHSIDVFGYRLVEPDRRQFLPESLAAFGIGGPDVGHLHRTGSIRVGDRVVAAEQVSEIRRGQRFAFIMDTRLCDNVYALADGADLLVIEATFLELAGQLRLPVAPVGDAWLHVHADHPGMSLWQDDGSHPTALGTYLAACVFYAAIFRASPDGLAFHGGVPDADARILQNEAGGRVLDMPTQWGLN